MDFLAFSHNLQNKKCKAFIGRIEKVAEQSLVTTNKKGYTVSIRKESGGVSDGKTSVADRGGIL